MTKDKEKKKTETPLSQSAVQGIVMLGFPKIPYWRCQKCAEHIGILGRFFSFFGLFHRCDPEDHIICFYRDGEFELTDDKWEKILLERIRKKKALDIEDLLKLFHQHND